MQATEELVGGSAWVNLANTVCFADGVMVDRLEGADDLFPFLLGNGLCREEQLVALQDAGRRAELVQKLKRLRGVFAQMLAHIDAEGRVEDVQAQELVHFVNELSVEYVCSWSEGEQKPAFRWRGLTMIDDLLLQFVNSCADTIATVSLDRIRQCEHEQCVLHFVDTSKAGKRRWCSMTTCGNRYKAAQYYTKHKRKSNGA